MAVRVREKKRGGGEREIYIKLIKYNIELNNKQKNIENCWKILKRFFICFVVDF